MQCYLVFIVIIILVLGCNTLIVPSVGSPGCSFYLLLYSFVLYFISSFAPSFWLTFFLNLRSSGSLQCLLVQFSIWYAICVFSQCTGVVLIVCSTTFFFSSFTNLSACCFCWLRYFVPHLRGSYGWRSFCLVHGSSSCSLFWGCHLLLQGRLVHLLALMISSFWLYRHCLLQLENLAAQCINIFTQLRIDWFTNWRFWSLNTYMCILAQSILQCKLFIKFADLQNSVSTVIIVKVKWECNSFIEDNR